MLKRLDLLARGDIFDLQENFKHFNDLVLRDMVIRGVVNLNGLHEVGNVGHRLGLLLLFENVAVLWVVDETQDMLLELTGFLSPVKQLAAYQFYLPSRQLVHVENFGILYDRVVENFVSVADYEFTNLLLIKLTKFELACQLDIHFLDLVAGHFAILHE